MIPLPTNLLPYWFFPWNTPSWYGYTPFVFHKELLAVDALRQIFPWKEFAFDQIRNGSWPLWNPYSFAGQPLIANFQSSVFYPLSWFFLFLPKTAAWSLYIFSQPVVAVLAMFLFLVNRLHDKLAAVVGSLALVFTGFFVTRYFWGVYLHPLIWLPFGLLLADKLQEKKISLPGFVLLQGLVFSLTILGGYPQHGFFALTIILAYFLFRLGWRKTPWLFLSLVLALLLSAVQLLPTLELYQNSLREGRASEINFQNAMIEPRDLVTIFSPDYFGSPATNNYFGGEDYSGVIAYVGIIPLILALYSLFSLTKRKETLFWFSVAMAGLALALRWPPAFLPSLLKIPILSSGSPWNTLFLYHFSVSVLSAVGFSQIVQKRDKKIFLSALLVNLVVILLLIAGRASAISFRNTLVILAFSLAFVLTLMLPGKLFATLSIILILVSGGYWLQKFSPFGEEKYFYPQHPLISYLQNYSGVDRYFGYRSSRIATNFSLHYKIFSSEGYDSLSPRWVGELSSSALTGRLPEVVNRADVILPEEDTFYRDRLLNLFGVKYFLEKSEGPHQLNQPNLPKFPAEKFRLLKDWGVVSIYENKKALPRAFLAGAYLVASGTAALDKIYDPGINLGTTLVLERDPKLSNLSSGSARITHYSPNRVAIETESVDNSILFLSDTDFPGWQARVNGRTANIIRADYAFRAVPVPAGRNNVVFSYQPESFRFGLAISFLAGFLYLCLIFERLLRSIGR